MPILKYCNIRLFKKAFQFKAQFVLILYVVVLIYILSSHSEPLRQARRHFNS